MPNFIHQTKEMSMTIKERISHLMPVAAQVGGSIKRRHSTPVTAMAGLGIAHWWCGGPHGPACGAETE